MSRRNEEIAAWIIGLLAVAAMLLFPRCASPADVAVMVGAEQTSGLGEETTPTILARGEAGRGPLYAEAAWSSADKIESHAGWFARAAVEARLGPVGLGAAYSHRDGGAWVKRTPWARASVGTRDVRLIVEHALGGYNRETKAEIRSYVRAGHVVVGLGLLAERHLQGTGFGASLLVGIGEGVKP